MYVYIYIYLVVVAGYTVRTLLYLSQLIHRGFWEETTLERERERERDMERGLVDMELREKV
jgi:hypothetical protein